MKSLLKLAKLLKGIYPRLFFITLFSFLFAAINSLWPIFTKWIVDNGPSLVLGKSFQEAVSSIVIIFLGLALIAFLMSLFDGLAWLLTDRTYNLANDKLFRAIYLRSQKLSHHYYEITSSGKIQEKINAGIGGLLSWIAMVSHNLLEPGSVIIFSLAIITWSSPLTGLLVLFSLVFYVWDFRIANKKSKLPRKELRKADEKRYGLIAEGFSHFATIRSLSAEQIIKRKVFRQSHDVLKLNNSLTNIWAWSISRRLLVSRLIAFMAICLQLFELWQGRATTGDIVMIMLYINQINGNILFFSRFLVATAENETKAERLLEFLEDTPIITDAPDALTLKNLYSLEFRNVSFSYPEGKEAVIEDISFKIDHSHSIALVGPSGVGKSTITKLMLRFYEPTKGEILINGQPVNTFTHESVRQHIGMVMQDVALFNTTVKENMTLAKATATRADLETAAEQAYADEFIENLPKKYNTVVGERGVKLSGGQKQRIAIARAILKDPDLIILDEATSALDSESERLVQSGLKRLMKDRLSLTIAHRLSTVRHADEILVLKKGTIAERGTHAELIKKPKGLYRKLFELQSATGKVKL